MGGHEHSNGHLESFCPRRQLRPSHKANTRRPTGATPFLQSAYCGLATVTKPLTPSRLTMSNRDVGGVAHTTPIRLPGEVTNAAGSTQPQRPPRGQRTMQAPVTLKSVLQQRPKGPSQPRTQYDCRPTPAQRHLSPKSKARPTSLYVANATPETGPRQLACLRKMTSGAHKRAKAAKDPAVRPVDLSPPSRAAIATAILQRR